MWSQGTIWTREGKVGYDYFTKHFDEPSDEFGIEGGKISKLSIRKHGETKWLANYDRFWDIEVPDDDKVKGVYKILLEKYN